MGYLSTTAQINRPLLHHPHHYHSSFSKPISTISLKTPLRPKLILKASSNSHSPNPQTLFNEKPISSILKTTCIAIAAASLFLSRFTKPSLAVSPVPTLESTTTTTTTTTTEEESSETDEEKERILEQHLSTNPEDIDALRTLMEIKLKDQKLLEAITIVDRLIQIEPLEKQWRLLKAHFHSYSGETELAKLGFEEIIQDDPLFVEAYHGLVMSASYSESEPGELETLLKRIDNAMEKCKIDKRKEDLRDFRLLVAQVRFIEGNYVEALKVYQELVKEEPRDFRPYLYQGIIYTLLRQTSEAKKQFEKYRRLVPKDHPYARYFEDNVMATEAFTQIIGSQKTSL